MPAMLLTMLLNCMSEPDPHTSDHAADHNPDLYGADAYAPAQIAQRVENAGVGKAKLALAQMIALGMLAGAFIGLGALFYTIVASDTSLAFAQQRLLGGLVFCLGLILVVLAGAELFTGNNLMVMAWVDRKISGSLLARNLFVVYVANFAGAALLSGLVMLSGHGDFNGGGIGTTAVAIAEAKCTLGFLQALGSGILCNILVCLAIWLTLGGRSVTDKILAIIFPITAFVAAGFEHCVANMYFLCLGKIMGAEISWAGIWLDNLLPVSLGNLIGGAGFVGLVYYVIYLRHRS